MQFKEIQSSINTPQIIIKSFIKDIHIAYSCSDIVISRAGALAIEELKSFNKAMILIPYPDSANNHQKFNAIEIADNNAGELIEQQDIELKLINRINYLLENDSQRKKIGDNARKLHNPDSLNLIIKSIKECLNV